VKGVNIGGTGAWPGLRVTPARSAIQVLVALDVALVAQAQVLVADALAAGQQRIGELLGRHADITVDVLEPFGGVARRVLDAQHLDAALGLVVVQRARQVGTAAADAAHQLDRVLEAQLGARADEKCAVWAASPISTTGARPLWCTQRWQITRGKRIHCADPRRCAALDISAWPSR
jgi:hypothetical protein